MVKWKTISKYPNYECSNTGLVRRKDTKHVQTGGKNRRYLRVKLFNENGGYGYDAHRIIAETWLPNPNNLPQVNHINGNKHDNRIKNLEWCTAQHNVKHSYETGLNKGPKSGERSNLSKISDDTLRYIKSIHKPFDKEFGTKALAKKYGINDAWLSNVLNGNRRDIEWT